MNVPPSYIQLPAFRPDVEEGLGRHPTLDRSRIELGTTESAGLVDERPWLGRLKDCRALGPGIAIDDFGTGYSSSARLVGLEAALIKIGRGFITFLPYGAPACSLLQGRVAIVQPTGSQVLAEVVETEEQARILGGFGCALVQATSSARRCLQARWRAGSPPGREPRGG